MGCDSRYASGPGYGWDVISEWVILGNSLPLKASLVVEMRQLWEFSVGGCHVWVGGGWVASCIGDAHNVVVVVVMERDFFDDSMTTYG